MGDVFVSYSQEDLDRIRPLVQAIESSGYSVWWDRQIPIGRNWKKIIEKAIDSARCIVVVWTARSVKSDWVRIEAGEGADRNILIPAMIDDVRLPLEFRQFQTAKLMDWRGESEHGELGKLMDGIRRVLEPATGKGVAGSAESVSRRSAELRVRASTEDQPPPEPISSERGEGNGELLQQLDQLYGEGDFAEPEDSSLNS